MAKWPRVNAGCIAWELLQWAYPDLLVPAHGHCGQGSLRRGRKATRDLSGLARVTRGCRAWSGWGVAKSRTGAVSTRRGPRNVMHAPARQSVSQQGKGCRAGISHGKP